MFIEGWWHGFQRAADWFALEGRGYQFWSGIGLPAGAIVTYWRRHNCHVERCWRLIFHSHPEHGHMVCRRHHPDGKGVKP